MLGAIIGDIAGSAYEFDNTRNYHCKLFPKGCDFTDDSVMTMAVASWLLKDPKHTHKVLEEEMVRYANAYPNPKGGYGGGFSTWLFSPEERKPYNSWGNGSAMRVSAVGWFFDTLEETERVERLEVDMRESAVTPGLPGSLSYASPDSTFSSRALSDYAAMKQELYHLGTREYGIELRCENIFVKDDVLYLVFSLRNDSAVSYEMSTPRFAVESARRSRRGLQYEKAVLPRSAYGMGTVAPGSESRMVFAFDKLALVKGQVFRVYFYEKGGSRNLRVTMSGRDVNGARRIN